MVDVETKAFFEEQERLDFENVRALLSVEAGSLSVQCLVRALAATESSFLEIRFDRGAVAVAVWLDQATGEEKAAREVIRMPGNFPLPRVGDQALRVLMSSENLAPAPSMANAALYEQVISTLAASAAGLPN